MFALYLRCANLVKTTFSCSAFNLAMELYRHTHWCKVVFFISLLHCVWGESDFMFS